MSYARAVTRVFLTRMGSETGDAKDGLLDLDDPVGSAKGVDSGITVSRETVRPAFDLKRYAEDSDIRERAPTITDEAAIEEARIASVLMDSRPPRAASASAPDVAVRYSDLDGLPLEEQLAVLRDRMDPLSRVASLSRPLTELGPLIEDPKTAYVLGFVDGLLPLETIVEIAGLPEIDTLRILDRALSQQVLEFKKKT